VITITGSSDHDRPELMITFAGIRTRTSRIDFLTVRVVTAHLGLRLQRERFQRLGVGFDAQVCTSNVRNLSALGI
jgi:hypothetical protein